jgi:threonine/homoserine/homoserine lactone efflux protein
MGGLHPIFVAALTGFTSGLLLCLPVGPVNLTIINEGARRGFKWAMLISLGATTMESLYCFGAFTSLASFFSRGYVEAAMKLFSFVFMLYLGIRMLTAKSVRTPVELRPLAEKLEERIEERLHPHSAFMIGFVRVLANPGVLVCWIVLGASFISRGFVEPNWPGKLACVAGVTVGTALWFAVLSFGASRGHGRFSEKTLIKIEHISGVGLLCLALGHGAWIVWEIAHRRP